MTHLPKILSEVDNDSIENYPVTMLYLQAVRDTYHPESVTELFHLLRVSIARDIKRLEISREETLRRQIEDEEKRLRQD